jgi:hypothetical protein
MAVVLVPFTVPASDGKSGSTLRIESNTKYQDFRIKIAIEMSRQLEDLTIAYRYSTSNQKNDFPIKITEDEYPKLMEFAASHVKAQQQKIASGKHVAKPFSVVISNLGGPPVPESKEKKKGKKGAKGKKVS